jgi:hypothetical protein
MDAALMMRPAWAWAAIVVLILLAVVRSTVANRTDGFTIDDAYHITAGVSYVINPNSFGALLTLGNLMLRRNQREEAMRFYERAREQLGNEEQATRPVLTRQIERLSSNEPLERIPPVRGTREEKFAAAEAATTSK